MGDMQQVINSTAETKALGHCLALKRMQECIAGRSLRREREELEQYCLSIH